MYKDEQAASPFDTNGTTMLSFILVMVAQVYARYLLEKIQPISNTRYLCFTKLICQISGVIACGLLLLLLLPIWWWIIISPRAFKSTRELHGSYHQISESLHGISAQVFNELHDTFQWICNTTQQAAPPAFNENSVRQKGEGGPPRVQNV